MSANSSAQELVDGVPEFGEEVLKITDLVVEFRNGGRRIPAVRGMSLTLRAGTVIGVAGESGSGKTTAALAAIGLLPPSAVAAGSVSYRGTELLGLKERHLRRHRGRHVAMIFQETAAALNPVMRVGDQLMMAAGTHVRGSKAAVRQRVVAALEEVRLAEASRVMDSYPHELSGGMCQRVIIAMALSCGSKVLLADEPTTALDVSVQEEILELIRGLVTRRRLAVMMISHDLAVLGDVCDEIAVMYQGEVVEMGHAGTVLSGPAHPYTQALLDCLPTLHGKRDMLPEIGSIQQVASPSGCRFRARCSWAADVCAQEPDLLPVKGQTTEGGLVRCWRSSEVWQLHRSAARTADSLTTSDRVRTLTEGNG